LIVSRLFREFLWRDNFIAAITQTGISVFRCKAGLKRSFEVVLDEEFNNEAPVSNEFEHNFPSAKTLEQLLSTSQIGKGVLHIVLSNSFVDYRVLPWMDSILTTEEISAHAKLRFNGPYGGADSVLKIAISSDRYGNARLAAATQQNLIQRIQDAVAPTSLRLGTVQPYLMSALNSVRHKLTQCDFMFLVSEQSRTCLLTFLDGEWHGVRSISVGGASEDIARIIERERCLAKAQDIPPQKTYVFCSQKEPLFLTNEAPVERLLPESLRTTLAVSDRHLMAWTLA